MSETRLDRYSQDDEKQFAQDTLRGERAIIGAVILDNSLMKHATEHLLPSSFNVIMHPPIFATMVELDKRGTAISVENIVNELRSHGDLEAAGGDEYVTSLGGDVPFRLTAEQPDYVDRFILVVIGRATSAAAISGDYSAKDVVNMYFEKTQKLRELRGWGESPLLKKSDKLMKGLEDEIDERDI